MNYLGRQIFDFDLNWASTPVSSFSFDLRDLQIGFGKRRISPTQKHVVRGFEFSLLVEGSEGERLSNFFESLRGSLKGFWFPSPKFAFEITQVISSLQIRIKGNDLLDAFQSRPDVHLIFSNGENIQAAKIESVVSDGEFENVTLLTEVDITTDWTARRLHYVRMASESEDITFLTTSTRIANLKVVELPTEYSEPETGAEPIYLYDFWLETSPVTRWRFTSFDADISSKGNNYISSATSHGSIRKSLRSDRDEVTLKAFYESAHPLSLFTKLPPSKRLGIQISETTLAQPNITTSLFTGYVIEAPRTGREITAKCSSFIDVLGQRVMSMVMQPRCNYGVFDAGTCKLDKALYQITGIIERIAGNVVRVSGAGFTGKSQDDLALGWIETGAGEKSEMRSVMASSVSSGNKVNLILDAEFSFAEEGQTAKVFPGCDGLSDTCINKYNNFDNYGGHRVAIDNPAIKGVEMADNSPNKK